MNTFRRPGSWHRQSTFSAAMMDLRGISSWSPSRWLTALAVTLLAAIAMGVPTGVLETSLYTRMTPVTWWNYPIWAVSAMLVGLTAATYIRGGGGSSAARDRSQRTLGAALISTFAIGCPICNKLVVTAIGVSGALSYWAPLQPLLGLLSVAALAAGLVVRLRGMTVCRTPSPS